MSSLTDVAKAAGVSIATVSRVISHPDKVASQTQMLVRKAMKELDYQPNRVARRLLREGLHPEDPVALLFERCCAYVVAVLGVLKAGGSFVPMDPNAPAAPDTPAPVPGGRIPLGVPVPVETPVPEMQPAG